MPRRTVIGFCGGIGSGKSLRSTHLHQLGAGVAPRTEAMRQLLESGKLPQRHRIDCDRVAHSCYSPGTPAFVDIVAAFGEGVVDTVAGTIDRKALGRIVFSDRQALQTLNGIVWPAIAARVAVMMDELPDEIGIVLVEAALLPEMRDLLSHCDSAWLYHANPEVALRRVATRDGLDANAVMARIAAQPSADERRDALVAFYRHAASPRGEAAVQVFDTSLDTEDDGCRKAEEALLAHLCAAP